MSKLFSPDSPAMEALSRLWDLIMLNLLYFFTCIPIVTIGAATTALYDVCFRLREERDHGLLRQYFRAFSGNFKQATIVWVVLLALFADIIWAIFLALAQVGVLRIVALPAIVMLAVLAMTGSYIFPLISRFSSKTLLLVKNAVILSIAYLPRSLLMAVLNCFPIFLLVAYPGDFLYLGFFWFTFYFSATAYFHCYLLKKVFEPYLDDAKEDEEA